MPAPKPTSEEVRWILTHPTEERVHRLLRKIKNYMPMNVYPHDVSATSYTKWEHFRLLLTITIWRNGDARHLGSSKILTSERTQQLFCQLLNGLFYQSLLSKGEAEPVFNLSYHSDKIPPFVQEQIDKTWGFRPSSNTRTVRHRPVVVPVQTRLSQTAEQQAEIIYRNDKLARAADLETLKTSGLVRQARAINKATDQAPSINPDTQRELSALRKRQLVSGHGKTYDHARRMRLEHQLEAGYPAALARLSHPVPSVLKMEALPRQPELVRAGTVTERKAEISKIRPSKPASRYVNTRIANPYHPKPETPTDEDADHIRKLNRSLSHQYYGRRLTKADIVPGMPNIFCAMLPTHLPPEKELSKALNAVAAGEGLLLNYEAGEPVPDEHRDAVWGHCLTVYREKQTLARVKKQLESDPDALNTYFFGRTPLHEAVLAGYPRVVAQLIAAGADIFTPMLTQTNPHSALELVATTEKVPLYVFTDSKPFQRLTETEKDTWFRRLLDRAISARKVDNTRMLLQILIDRSQQPLEYGFLCALAERTRGYMPAVFQMVQSLLAPYEHQREMAARIQEGLLYRFFRSSRCDTIITQLTNDLRENRLTTQQVVNCLQITRANTGEHLGMVFDDNRERLFRYLLLLNNILQADPEQADAVHHLAENVPEAQWARILEQVQTRPELGALFRQIVRPPTYQVVLTELTTETTAEPAEMPLKTPPYTIDLEKTALAEAEREAEPETAAKVAEAGESVAAGAISAAEPVTLHRPILAPDSRVWLSPAAGSAEAELPEFPAVPQTEMPQALTDFPVVPSTELSEVAPPPYAPPRNTTVSYA